MTINVLSYLTQQNPYSLKIFLNLSKNYIMDTLTILSSLLATVAANLCSPANSEIMNKYSGALTWLDRWVRPVIRNVKI